MHSIAYTPHEILCGQHPPSMVDALFHMANHINHIQSMPPQRMPFKTFGSIEANGWQHKPQKHYCTCKWWTGSITVANGLHILDIEKLPPFLQTSTPLQNGKCNKVLEEDPFYTQNTWIKQVSLSILLTFKNYRMYIYRPKVYEPSIFHMVHTKQ